MYVCLSHDNFRNSWPRKFIFAHPVYLQSVRVKFVYEGHRVTVKVTEPKSPKCLFLQYKNFDRLTLAWRLTAAYRIAWPPYLSRDRKWPRVTCLSVCMTITFERLEVQTKFIFAHLVYLPAVRVKFVYKGHGDKVKVTEVENVQNACFRSVIFDRPWLWFYKRYSHQVCI